MNGTQETCRLIQAEIAHAKAAALGRALRRS